MSLVSRILPSPLRARRSATVAAALGLAAVAVLGLTAGFVPSSSAGYIAKITNSTDTAATAPYFTCATAATADKSTAFFQYALNDSTASTSAVDASGNARTGTYTGTRATSTTTPQSCSRDTGPAAVFNGSTNQVTTPTQLSTAPATFTLEVWFKTTVAGGKLIGYGNSQSGSSGQYDRHLYISTTGALIFGVYNGGVNTITSPLAYNDGLWHDAIVTFSASTGSLMYVDGKLVASNTSYTAGEAHAGYWRIGYDNLSGWPNAAANYWFTGSMRFAAVYTSVFTPAQVSAHYAAGA
ncbi:LamG domain-containing protein [Frondihabitans cladoniiphilus]|uniref:Concanavalin A-like lectin/glucanase superfamily protein n=1 Tax=Frondihabitans cladoniiphilus TaxID=715785 RepID=A0ABP8W687_9MICO